METDMRYQMKSIEQMFRDFAYENDRASRTDAKATQKAIVLELYRRLKASLDMLETATEDEAAQIYKQFIEH